MRVRQTGLPKPSDNAATGSPSQNQGMRRGSGRSAGQQLDGGQADLLAKLINGGFTIETFFISL